MRRQDAGLDETAPGSRSASRCHRRRVSIARHSAGALCVPLERGSSHLRVTGGNQIECCAAPNCSRGRFRTRRTTHDWLRQSPWKQRQLRRFFRRRHAGGGRRVAAQSSRAPVCADPHPMNPGRAPGHRREAILGSRLIPMKSSSPLPGGKVCGFVGDRKRPGCRATGTSEGSMKRTPVAPVACNPNDSVPRRARPAADLDPVGSKRHRHQRPAAPARLCGAPIGSIRSLPPPFPGFR